MLYNRVDMAIVRVVLDEYLKYKVPIERKKATD